MDLYLSQAHLRPALEAGQLVGKNWTRLNEQDADMRGLQDQFLQLRRDLAPQIDSNSYGHFPFRIYQLPDYLRTTLDPATDWLRFCVRAGTVFINWTEFAATETDGEPDPDDNTYPLAAGAGVNEVLLTAGVAKHWFWLACDDSGAEVDHGATPPTWSVNYIPIGWVDTTDTTNKLAKIRQLVRTDLFTCV